MNIHKVGSIKNTTISEDNFNVTYHNRYIDKIGEEIKHDYKSGVFRNFICLGFDKNEKGQFTDADWFHKEDLRLP
jgi:hypothetical protein